MTKTTAPRKLTPTQWRVLAALAAPDARLSATWDGMSYRLSPSWEAVRWETREALEQRSYIARNPHTWPREWRITEAGRQALHAQEASDA